ncbi:glycosyltransferase family 2 protein [Butyrivibrio sp. WCD2001]|uniref:glycosyltransferase family 2 protein n=1 Tax=Butyrivibrio sp. WCD2001 TaxID=1280681 RepID=UPI0004292B45|nr:glycosyltransferase family 2 protein [Butyrivibrio sp. WCD2001]
MKDISHFYYKGIEPERQPLVTVAISCYDVEKYISRCIESVLAQTYSNLDILILDDGSRDRTGNICDYYQTQDSRIRVVHQSNQGPGTARNYLLDMAFGDFIAFLDGDDYVEKYIYEYMVSAILETQCPLAICKYYENKEEDPVKRYQLTEDMRANRLRIIPRDELITGLIEESDELPVRSMVWNKLYHRSILEERRFPGVMFYEDKLFTLQVLGDVEEAVFIDTPLYHYIIDRKEGLRTQAGFFCIFSEWLPSLRDARNYLCSIGREDLAWSQDYLKYKQLLDYYSEAKRDKLGDKSKYLPDITAEIEKCKDSFDKIYGCRIADPKEKKRMQKFLEHRWTYDHFYLR